jgi:hypothetical protein
MAEAVHLARARGLLEAHCAGRVTASGLATDGLQETAA